MRAEDVPLLVAMFLLPWVFGGVQLWAYRAAGFLLALAAATALVRGGFQGLGIDRSVSWLAPAALLAALSLLQVLPIPPTLLEVLSPSADEILRASYLGYPGKPQEGLVAAAEEDALRRVPEAREFASPKTMTELPRVEAGGRWHGWRPLSLHPDATVERLFWFLALLLAFLVCRARARAIEAFRIYRSMLFILFLALALFGIAQKVTWNGRMYWVGPSVEWTRPFGPYLDCVHFAGVMEIAAPWLLGWAWSRTLRLGRGARRDPATLAAWGGVFVVLVATFAAASKMGAVLVVAGVSTLVTFGIVRRDLRRFAVVVLLVVWASVAGLATETEIGSRMRSLIAESRGGLGSFERVDAWRAALPMVADFPVAGVGMGAFRVVFPRYLHAGESGYWDRLHNDYLEVTIEGGIPAAVLVLLLSASFWKRAIRGVRMAHRGERAARLGLAIGLAVLSVHALVDFNHQIPANALLFVFCAALALRGSEAPDLATP